MMIQKLKQKLKNKDGMSTIEFVICMLIFIMVTAFIIDLFIVSYKHYVVSANCTKAARVISIQGGLGNACPENYPGGNPNYMTNKEFRTYLNELSQTVQDDIGSFNVYIDYSYIDNYDNVIEKEDVLVYKMTRNQSGAISRTYYPQDFLLPYGSFITLKVEYSYAFFYTNIWFNLDDVYKFRSSKSYVTEYVSYDFGYHVDGQKILTVVEDLPSLNTTLGGGPAATEGGYFTYSGNAITGLSEEGKAAHLTDIVLPTHIAGNAINQIADGAFANCDSLISVTITNNIKRIGANAFNGCDNLVSVRYYEGVERIDGAAFAGCSSLTFFGPAYNYQDADLVAGGTTPARIILPASLQELHSNAFTNCSQIKRVRVGANLVKMADNVFDNTLVSVIYLEGPEGSILGAPWKYAENATGNWVPDETVTVSWNSKRVN